MPSETEPGGGGMDKTTPSVFLPTVRGCSLQETWMSKGEITGCKDQIRPRSERDNDSRTRRRFVLRAALLALPVKLIASRAALPYKARYQDFTSGLHILI